MSRTGQVTRKTKETDISVVIDLDGTGIARVGTGVGFFDHMLEQIARHGMLDLEVTCQGDLHIDQHHTVEDTGIAIGQALKQALGEARGIRRYGHALLPMDETLAMAALDLSGRPFLVFDAEFSRPKVGDFDTELVVEFWRGLAMGAGATLHLKIVHGANNHHMIEALFKAFARALDDAKQVDSRLNGAVPSTKGVL